MRRFKEMFGDISKLGIALAMLPFPTIPKFVALPPQSSVVAPANLIENPMQLVTEKDFEMAFMQDYEYFMANFLVDAGDGALRVVHDPRVLDSSLEMQGLGEIFALFAGDKDTLNALAKYDRRYIDERGLAPWYMNPDGSVGDETVVSNTMMTLAWVRLRSGNPILEEEGKKIIEGIKQYLINHETNVPTAFHWPGSIDLTNPAYLNPLFMQDFAQYDPYWEVVAQSSRELMNKVATHIVSGEIATFPNWVDMQGRPVNKEDTGVKLGINYDLTYVVMQQAQGVLFGKSEEIRENAMQQISLLNDFFYQRIAVEGTYNIDNLFDGYNIDGSLDDSEPRSSKTAFASAAFIAALVASEDPAYKSYMLEQFRQLPTDYSFNLYMHAYANLLFSGKLKNC